MISFVKAAYQNCKMDECSIFKDCKNVLNTNFIEPIVIDPSMLDSVHNVLDLILATLYKKFNGEYDKDNQSFYMREREELLDQFQKRQRSGSGNSIEHVSRYLGRRTAQSAKKIWTVWLLISRGIIL